MMRKLKLYQILFDLYVAFVYCKSMMKLRAIHKK